MGGLVKKLLNLQSKVETMEKKLEDKFTKYVETILEKQKILDKAIAYYSAAITKLIRTFCNQAKPNRMKSSKTLPKTKPVRKLL